MGRRVKRPGWLWSVSLGRIFIAVSVSTITPFFVYLMVLTFWLDDLSSDWVRLPGSWLAFLFATAFCIPLAISAISGVLDATIARSRGRQVRGLLFSGTALVPDVRVSPSRPYFFAEGRPGFVMRITLLAVVAVPALAVMNAQLGLDGPGPFRAYWVGAVAAGWSMIALPSATLDLLGTYLYPASTPQVRARRFKILALAFVGLLVAWVVVTALWSEALPLEESVVATMMSSVFVGLMLAALTAYSVALAQRAISRDLRHAAVEAVAIDGRLRASDALSKHETPGFLVTDQGGQLVGWLSRGDALGSPDSLLSDLARPLIDPVPIAAEQQVSDLCQALDPHIDGAAVVALAHDATPVGFIVVSDAFRYVTGDSAWSRTPNPA